MATALQGRAQILELSEDNVTWKTIVCTNAIEHTNESQTSDVSTACGTFVGVGSPTWGWSVDGVCDALRDSSTQVTFRDLDYWLHNSTSLYVRFRSAASGSVTQGLAFNISGQVIISKANLKSDDGQVVTFSADIKGQGTKTIA